MFHVELRRMEQAEKNSRRGVRVLNLQLLQAAREELLYRLHLHRLINLIALASRRGIRIATRRRRES